METTAANQFSYAFCLDFNHCPNIHGQPGQPDPSLFACSSKCFLSLQDRARFTSFNHLKSLLKTTADTSANSYASDSPAQPRRLFGVHRGPDNSQHVQHPDPEPSYSWYPQKTPNQHQTCSQHQIGISPLLKAQESHVLQGSIQNTERWGYDTEICRVVSTQIPLPRRYRKENDSKQLRMLIHMISNCPKVGGEQKSE